MKLSTKQIAHLRGLAHSLNPVVMIGNNGLTENVIKEIELNLNSHELIKVKVSGDDRDVRCYGWLIEHGKKGPDGTGVLANNVKKTWYAQRDADDGCRAAAV